MNLFRMLALALCCLVAAPGPARAETDAQATQRLHALFDAEWDWDMRDDPERATYLGDHRFGAQLTDRSRAADDARYAHARERLAALRAIDRARLAPADRVSYDIMLRSTQDGLAGEQFTGMATLMLDGEGGLHNDLADLLRVSPAATEADVRNLLARLAQFPGRVEQVVARLREGIALQWVAARSSLQQVPAQIDGQLPDDVTRSPLYEPFTRIGAAIPEATRNALAAEGATALRTQVYPAMRKLRAFVVDEYLPRSTGTGAMGARPNGADAYDHLVRQHTTTDLSAAQVHAIGLREMARLRGEMEAQVRAAGFTGSFAAFVRFLNTDPRFFHTDPEALLAGYRDIAKRVDPELPKLFAELPRTPYGVRAIPAHEGIGKSENYSGPPRDGRGAGWFNANVVAIAQRPIWNMETLFAHEAVPGHHLQIARARELENLPQFRRGGGYTAYVEGWALYAETLGPELGLYKTPYTRFGHLQWQSLRAARLVVDTGIHAFGWQRQQAIDWMTERTGMVREFIEPQVDRYFVVPGQALSYMIGQLKIVELRDRARAALGPRFDIRRFHMAVLDNGAMPLGALEQQIDDWIAREKARETPRP
jgi:uncharacterized protein (DUF885 family)